MSAGTVVMCDQRQRLLRRDHNRRRRGNRQADLADAGLEIERCAAGVIGDRDALWRERGDRQCDLLRRRSAIGLAGAEAQRFAKQQCQRRARLGHPIGPAAPPDLQRRRGLFVRHWRRAVDVRAAQAAPARADRADTARRHRCAIARARPAPAARRARRRRAARTAACALPANSSGRCRRSKGGPRSRGHTAWSRTARWSGR